MDRRFGVSPTLHREGNGIDGHRQRVPVGQRDASVVEGIDGAGFDDRPQRVTTGAAMLRHPVLTVLCLALVLFPSLTYALTRTPEFTAESRLLVGRVDVEAQAVPGFTQATQELAALYARVVDTDVVVAPVAEQLGVPVEEVRAAVSASPIPEAAIIRLEATAETDEASRRIADAAARSLAAHVDTLGAGDPLTSRAFDRLTAATAALGDAQVRQRSIQAGIDQRRAILLDARLGEPNLPPVEQLEDEIRQLNADLTAVTGEVLRLQGEVNAAQAGFNTASRDVGEMAGVEVLGAAASQGSDRATSVAAAGIAGLVGGVLVALGIVTLWANLGYLASVRDEVRDPRSPAGSSPRRRHRAPVA